MTAECNITTVRDLIGWAAATQPQKNYLIGPDTGQTCTYGELKQRAERLHARLAGIGLEPGDKIAFLMDNGVATAEFFLGIMYGGFVAVPLNVRAGVSQLSYSLLHSRAKVVFVANRYTDLIAAVLAGCEGAVQIIAADTEWRRAEQTASAAPAILPQIAAGDAAMLMYTSGSTGQPKGAIHTHHSILAHGRNSVAAHQLTAADRSLLVLPVYHINAECVTLVPTLMSGGSVVIPQGFAVSEFWNWLHDYECTWSAIVPAIIAQLLDWRDPKSDTRAEAFKRIRFLRSSSAPLSASLHREFIEKFKLPLLQAMGSTEAGNVFSNPVPPGVNKIGSPGLPWGFEARIIDAAGRPLPAGEPGEVLLRGDGMMQGYFEDPQATEAALDSEGWLRTGDLAYRDEDGYFFIIGRSKELIIKAGVNIAPKQIDEVLEAHPAVLEAAAVGAPDRHVGEDVIAFAVLRQDMACSERDLLSFCAQRLGDFKTPTRIHLVPDLPKGPSGKVQRLRLVEQAEILAPATPPPTARDAALQPACPAIAGQLPGTDMQAGQIISRIWAELLGLESVDPDSNFFSLGGQSLLAMQYLSRLRESLPVILTLSDFFENPTVSLQAALVRSRLMAQPGQDTASDLASEAWQRIERRQQSGRCPLSPSQERIWFMEQLSTGEPAYNESEAILIRGPLDTDALQRALNGIVERHEILRTTIEQRDGRAVGVVHETWPLLLREISLRALPEAGREAELARLVVDEVRRPYQIETAPGIRATLVRLSQQEHALILMMHHIICDSSSLGIFWRELRALYGAARTGEPCNLQNLPVQYGDYAAWQLDKRHQARIAADIDFWRETLRGAPALLNLPADRPRPATMSYRGNTLPFHLDAALASGLRRLGRELGSSLFTIIAAALNTLFYRYTDQDDIVIGIPMADRERPEVQHLIGFLIGTQVLRTDISGNPSFRQLLERVQKSVAQLHAHQAAQFDQIVAAVRPPRNPAFSPVFQIMFIWRDYQDQPQFIGLPGLAVQPLLAHPATSKFDLTVIATDTQDDIYLEVEYSTDLFDAARIERMIGHLSTLLAGAVSDPHQNVASLPLLTSAERQQLLGEWNEVQADEVY